MSILERRLRASERAGAAGGRGDAGPVRPVGGLGAGSAPGHRRAGPRRAVPLLRRTACSRPGGRGGRRDRARPRRRRGRPGRPGTRGGDRRVWCALRTRSAGRCSAAGWRPPTRTSGGYCWRSTRGATTASASCGTCASTNTTASCCASPTTTGRTSTSTSSSAYAALDDCRRRPGAVAEHLRTAVPEPQVIVDLATWRHGRHLGIEETAPVVEDLLARLRLRPRAVAGGRDRDHHRRRRGRARSARCT